MKKSWSLFALVVAASLCQAPKALGSVGGVNLFCVPVVEALYTNLAGLSMNFELSVTNGCGDSLLVSWTDASGHAQTVTVPSTASTSISSSLPAGGAVSWSKSGSSGNGFTWELERAPAQSVAGGLPEALCGSAGTLYTNLRTGSVVLDLGVANGPSCALTLSWTDAFGHARTINLAAGGSQGVSTSLPAGGVISWTSSSGPNPVGATWQLERVVTTKLW